MKCVLYEESRRLGFACMRLTLRELQDIQADAMADDVDIDLEKMSCWTPEQAMKYFESGGAEEPLAAEGTEAVDITESSTAPDADLSVKDRRAKLAHAGISTDECVEKVHMLELCQQQTGCTRTASHSSAGSCAALTAPAAPAAPEASAAAPAPAPPPAWWEDISTINLKKLLLSINISMDGCAERADLVELAEKHRSALEHTRTVSAAAPTTSSSSSFHVPHHGVADGARGNSTDSAVDRLRQQGEAAGKGGGGIVDSPQAQKQLAAERREREALRAARRGDGSGGSLYKPDTGISGDHQAVAAMRQSRDYATREAARPQPCVGDLATQRRLRASGGYMVDMFGRKRGACLKDTSCYRFAPPPPTAGRVLAQATCERCGRSAGDHEDFGGRRDGEPDLVDEQGRCYRITLEGGGGAHDSATVKYTLMEGYRWTNPQAEGVAEEVGRGSYAAADAKEALEAGRGGGAGTQQDAAAMVAQRAAAESAAAAERLRRECKAARDVD